VSKRVGAAEYDNKLLKLVHLLAVYKHTYYSICVTTLKINFVSDSLRRVFLYYRSENTLLLISKASKLVLLVFRKWWYSYIVLPVCISYWTEYPTSAYLVKGRALVG
jgi:radical SAM superfamily enzyme YgiQ (UPF0313 family)